jgi:hypothetical protein
MATESIIEKREPTFVNGSGQGEATTPAGRSKVAKKIYKKSRAETAMPSVRYFLGGDSSSSTPHLAEERTSELEAITEAFRRQVSFFVVQEFAVEVQNQNGAPLLRKRPVKDRASP